MPSEVMIFANMLLCLGIAYSCKCRLDKTDRTVYKRVIYFYALIGTGALFNAFGHWIFRFPGGEYVGGIIFASSIAGAFCLDAIMWKEGAPYSATKPGELLDATGRPIRS